MYWKLHEGLATLTVNSYARRCESVGADSRCGDEQKKGTDACVGPRQAERLGVRARVAPNCSHVWSLRSIIGFRPVT